MSRSPTERAASEEQAYRRGWEALFHILDSGGSLSGRERNCCYLNLGQGTFADISAVAGVDFADDGRAIGLVDWDHDGRLDAWFGNRTAPRARLLLNRGPADHHFVAVHLEGQTCNRDAIGARLELHLHGQPKWRPVRTLRAGEGYLAQSSKWIHFGLGRHSDIERLVVRWPDGKVESFSGIDADRRYHVVQGTGRAEPWQRPQSCGPLAESPPDPPQSSERARIVPLGRVPLPGPLHYRRFDGRRVELAPSRIPLLIHFWASWCRPCAVELDEITRHAAAIQPQLRIVALSVDEPATHSSAQAMLEKLAWPFDAGLATSELTSLLDALQRSLVSRKDPMPLPTSFLVDSRGGVAVVYKGPISAEQLLADLELASTYDPRQIAEHALPFPGYWHRTPPAANLSQWNFAEELIKAGHGEQAERYLAVLAQVVLGADALDSSTDSASGLPAADESTTVNHNPPVAGASGGHPREFGQADSTRSRLSGSFVNLGVHWSKTGHEDRAIRAFEQAVALDPAHVKARYNLAIALEETGDFNAAMAHLERALEANPQHAEAHFNLASLYLRQGQHGPAEVHLRETVSIRPQFAQGHYNLGLVLLLSGRKDEAIRHLETAIALEPDFADAHYNLANALLAAGRHDEAAESYARVLEIRPDHADAHTNRAAILLERGHAGPAVEHLRRAAELSPESAKSQFNLGAALTKQGNAAEGLAHFRAAIKRDSTYVAPFVAAAKLLASDEYPELLNLEEALRLAERAAELTGGNNPQVLELLGSIYEASGRRAEAGRSTAEIHRRGAEGAEKGM